MPVTTPACTIRDVHPGHLGPALIRQVIANGRRGELPLGEADGLAGEWWHSDPSGK